MWTAPSAARFVDAAPMGGNTLSTDTLNPPGSLIATVGANVMLTWTATPDLYAAGYRVLRGTVSGGPYSQIAQVTPRTTTAYVDNPGPGTFYYVVRSYFQNWESVNSNQASAAVSAQTGFQGCGTTAPVTVGSGDNDGFQANPGNACTDDGAYARDTNSGTTASTSCADAGKDRHLFYNYGFALPPAATINGIEVRVDARVDATAGAPFICVDLSWNAGVAWTAVKMTPVLTTGELTYILGANNDTWGHVWNSAELSNGPVRVRLTDVSSNTNRDFRVDLVAVRVTYTP